MHNVFLLVNPVYDMHIHIVKVTVFLKKAKHEQKNVFNSFLRVFNM